MDINNLHIDDRIFQVRFSCDLNRCKGACCTIKGTLGAPTNEEEITQIYDILSKIKPYLKNENIRILDNEGIYVHYDNKLWLNTVKDSECVFSYYKDGIAYCSFQTAFIERKIKFKKPISCDLFPVRVDKSNHITLRYEKFYECEPALELGKLENNTIFEYVGDALKREFGLSFYSKFIPLINKDK